MTVKQAIAASATTLQQCGLPGSSAQPGGTAAAHGTGGGGLGGKGLRRAGLPGREGERLQPELQRGDALAARSATKQCPQEGIAAVPVSWGALPRPCVREAAQPPAWLLSPPHSGLQAMAPSQSLIPAYPPLTSFQDSAADARDLRVVLCTAQRRAHAGGHGAATPVVKGVWRT